MRTGHDREWVLIAQYCFERLTIFIEVGARQHLCHTAQTVAALVSSRRSMRGRAILWGDLLCVLHLYSRPDRPQMWVPRAWCGTLISYSDKSPSRPEWGHLLRPTDFLEPTPFPLFVGRPRRRVPRQDHWHDEDEELAEQEYSEARAELVALHVYNQHVASVASFDMKVAQSQVV